MLFMLVKVSEYVTEMGRSKHWSKEQCTLIKKLSGEARMYKEVQKTRLFS